MNQVVEKLSKAIADGSATHHHYEVARKLLHDQQFQMSFDQTREVADLLDGLPTVDADDSSAVVGLRAVQ